MSKWIGKIFARQAIPAPEGWFVATDGTSTGAGTIDDPWDLQTAGFGGPGGTWIAPASDVQPGDTVWLRQGTYTIADNVTLGGHFIFTVAGTAANPITFRSYPGELATLDANYDGVTVGDNSELIVFADYFSQGVRGYMILRDVEIMNSMVNRLTGVWPDGTPHTTVGVGPQRTNSFTISAPFCKVVNCIIHDNGVSGGFTSSYGPGWEVYGNLIYYNGFYWPFLEQNHAASVDLIPAGGTAVARSGTWKVQNSGATSITITNHVNPGDYTLVAVNKNGLNYSTITATFDGTAMTLLTGVNGYSKSVAMFGLKGHTTTANVTVQSNDSASVRAIAQSFVNVNQNATETFNAVPGTFTVSDGAMSLNGTTLTSATGSFTANHAGQPIEVTGAGLSASILKTYVASYTNPTTLELVHTSYANVTGKLVTIRGGTWWNNQWGDALWRVDGSQPGACWENPIQGAVAGQNQYIGFTIATPSDTNHMVVDAMAIYSSYGTYHHPEGDNTYSVSDAAMTTGSTTLTSTTGGFTSDQQGLPIRVVGAGAGGAVLYTTIATFSNANTLILTAANASGGNVTGAQAFVHNMLGGPSNTTMIGVNPQVKMSFGTRTGAGLVNMGWGWSAKIDAAGHGSYCQGGTHGTVTTTSGSATINATESIFRPNYVGATIRILEAGTAGADLVTTIASYVTSRQITLNAPLPAASVTKEVSAYYPQRMKHNIFWDQWYEGIQVYGSSDACSVGDTIEENFWFNNNIFLGGLGGFRMTDTVFQNNYSYSLSTQIGDTMAHMRNFRLEGNYLHDHSSIAVGAGTWDTMVIGSPGHENTVIGTWDSNFSSVNWPDNTYSASNPASNYIVVQPNEYETNRCNILVYNWENLTTVDVDISSAVAVGTPINVMNSRDYFATPVLTTVYAGGTINLPMTGLTVASIICANANPLAVLAPKPSTAPEFMAFIVRAQSTETWR